MAARVERDASDEPLACYRCGRGRRWRDRYCERCWRSRVAPKLARERVERAQLPLSEATAPPAPLERLPAGSPAGRAVARLRAERVANANASAPPAPASTPERPRRRARASGTQLELFS